MLAVIFKLMMKLIPLAFSSSVRISSLHLEEHRTEASSTSLHFHGMGVMGEKGIQNKTYH
jgi:hypothetical protein